MENGIVFDFDGPIFDGRGAAQRAIDKTRLHFNLGEPLVRFSSLPLLNPRSLIPLLFWDSKITVDQLTEIENFYRKQLIEEERETEINPLVRALLRRLNQEEWRCAIYSGRSQADLDQLLRNSGLHQNFKLICGRDSGSKPKPAPDGLLEILRRFNLPAPDLFFIGDSELDYLASKNAGTSYYHAAWTGEPTTTPVLEAAIVINRIEDLNGILFPESRVQTKPSHFPPDLEDAIRASEFSFYAGAGISIPSGIGGWENHYMPILRQLGLVHLTKDHELPELLQMFASEPMRAKKLYDQFAESFRKPDLKPSTYHFAMLRSRVPHIWTSNYDQLFERGNEIGGFGRSVVHNDQALLQNFRNQRLVVKMNGDFQKSSYRDDLDWDMIFLQEQFDLAEERRKEIWRLFEDDYRNRSIIFVGVSFRDPVLRRIVALAARKIPRTKRSHYLLIKSSNNLFEEGQNRLYAERLARHNITTVFKKTYDDIVRLVERAALLSHRPIVGFAGSVGTGDGQGSLPNGKITIGELAEFCSTLGRQLAIRGFRVTSGGASHVGIPAVSAAFEENPTLARIYLRKIGGGTYNRTAPTVVVRGGTYEDMRKRFIPELRLLIAIAGRTNQPTSGLINEIEMALSFSIPVLLFPWAGGTAFVYRSQFLDRVSQAYRDGRLANAVRKANDQIGQLDPSQHQQHAQGLIPDLVEDLIATLMSSSVSEPPDAGLAMSW